MYLFIYFLFIYLYIYIYIYLFIYFKKSAQVGTSWSLLDTLGHSWSGPGVERPQTAQEMPRKAPEEPQVRPETFQKAFRELFNIKVQVPSTQFSLAPCILMLGIPYINK